VDARQSSLRWLRGQQARLWLISTRTRDFVVSGALQDSRVYEKLCHGATLDSCISNPGPSLCCTASQMGDRGWNMRRRTMKLDAQAKMLTKGSPRNFAGE
jgi:hypothetical protein